MQSSILPNVPFLASKLQLGRQGVVKVSTGVKQPASGSHVHFRANKKAHMQQSLEVVAGHGDACCEEPVRDVAETHVASCMLSVIFRLIVSLQACPLLF